ncbi:MAG: glycosyltransferase [Pelotomaculum sp.]
MKILCFINNLGAGGGQRQLVNLGILFFQKGYDVTFLTYDQDNFFIPQLTSIGINVEYIENSNPLDRILKIRKYIRKAKAEFVISFLETPNFISCMSAIGKHSWKLITNELSAKPSSFKGIRNRLFKSVEIFSDHIVCNSYNAMKMWEEHYPKYLSKLSTIYNPVILPPISAENVIDNTDDRIVHIVVPASYQILKNPFAVIDAVRGMTDSDRKKIEICWYGKVEVTRGNTRVYDKAVKLAKEYKVEKHIKFYPETKDIYEKMQRADVVGLFSTVEGLPNAICEGMSFGKPIIMTPVSDYRKLVVDNGILCDGFDAISIRTGLQKLIHLEKKDLLEMGNKSQIMASKLFSKEAIIEKWEELFDRLSGNVGVGSF